MSDFLPFGANVYVERRSILKATLISGSVLLLGNDDSPANFADNCYPFRQDSTFLYYFGIDRPGLIAVIDIDADQDIIFGDDGTIDDVVWTGYVPPLSELAEKVGVHMVYSRVKAINFINTATKYLPPYRSDHEKILSALLGYKPRKVLSRSSIELIRAICDQREIKSESEITHINEAVCISGKMHLEVMKNARTGMKEHELVAFASKIAYDHNVQFSFQPIMTTRGEVLHNHYYGNQLKEGDMILFDGGCESVSHYAGDITRTFPVSERFDSKQKDIYDIVHSAYQRAIETAITGVEFRDVHLGACRSLIEGLKGLNLMKGNVEDALMANAHTMFFQCGLGHMMGLDVHDMENYGEEHIGYASHQNKSKEFGLKSLRLAKPLKVGHVLTIEPGIYIIPSLIDLRKSESAFTDFINYQELEGWRNFGGIRLEDDFVIRPDGAHILGIKMPTTSDEIEAIRSGT